MTDQTPATETIDQRAARMQRERQERFLSGQPASAFAAHRADPQTPATEALSIIRDAMNDASLRHENVRLTREQARLIRAALSEAEARASLDVDVLARALCDKPPGVCFDWDIHVTQARNVLPRLLAILDEANRV